MSGGDASGVEIRPSQESDKPIILSLWSTAGSPSATGADDGAAVERLLASDAHALLVAQLGGRIVGATIAVWDGWRGHIYRLAVLPEYRLQGIGRQLVVAGQERLRGLGATKINASVSRDDPGPIAFWESIGYRSDHRMSRFTKVF